MTQNCPVGLRALRKRLSYLAKAASAAVLSFFAGLGVYKMVTPAPLTTPRMGVMVETMGDIVLLKDKESGTTIPLGVGLHHGRKRLEYQPASAEKGAQFTAAPKSRRKKGKAS